jgi:hypothetical protein
VGGKELLAGREEIAPFPFGPFDWHPDKHEVAPFVQLPVLGFFGRKESVMLSVWTGGVTEPLRVLKTI